MSISNSFYNYITFLQSAEFAAAVAGLLLIAGFLIFGRRFKGSKRVEDIMFGYLGVSALIYAVFGVLRCYVLINTQFFYEIGVLSFAYKIVDVAYLFYAFMWVLFIDASLYHSTDGLKRRYSLAVVPYVVIIGLLLINSFLEGYINAGDRGTLNSTGMLMDVLDLSRLLSLSVFFISFILGAAYMLYARRLSVSYQKDIRQPVFLRLDVFFIPWLIGWIPMLLMYISSFFDMKYHLRLPDFSVLCAAVSLVLTHLSMKNRYRYLDYETGFYKEEFLDNITEFMEKKHAPVNCGVLIRVSGKRQEFAKILSDQRPERSTVILLSEDGFVLFSDVRSSSAVKLLEQDLREASDEQIPGIDLNITVRFREKDEAMEAFRNRMINEFRNENA
ncbi:MAG: hypothetical protein IIZ75_08625 [Lachnospiraceae bacterium]|nr:hypothetical protein [Lachnospiraceae bacterium]